MANLQVQARALGDPTRHKVFRAIVDGDAPDPLTVLIQIGRDDAHGQGLQRKGVR